MRLNVCEPALVLGIFSLDYVKEGFLNVFGDRPAAARADLAVIDFADRSLFFVGR